MFGLPDVEVFAFRLSPIIIAGLVGLAMIFGWRGLMAGAILLYIWASSSPSNQPPPPAQRGANRAAGVAGPGTRGAGDFFQQLQSGQTSGLQQLGVGGAGGGPAGSPGSATQPPASHSSGSAFQGRGQKLGGSS